MLNQATESCISRLGGLFPSFGSSFVPLRLEQLAALEDRVGVLPEDYRAFILIYGNSRFDHLVGKRFPPDRTVFVSSFYGGEGDVDAACTLAWAMKVYEGRMPTSAIPIAECAEQGEICLVVSGSERGKIYFWDRSNEWVASEDKTATLPEIQFQNMTKLADSFGDFMCGLEVIDE